VLRQKLRIQVSEQRRSGGRAAPDFKALTELTLRAQDYEVASSVALEYLGSNARAANATTRSILRISTSDLWPSPQQNRQY